MRASILIPTFRRNALLDLGLQSIRRQKQDVEIIILNDGEPTQATSDIAMKYDCKFIQCRDTVDKWRIPGFAFNIGIKEASTNIIIFTCPEIWHHAPCLNGIITIVEQDKKLMATGFGRDGKINYIKDNIVSYNKSNFLNTALPFLTAVSKKILLDIGGYDEDFLGKCYDDNDIMNRLLTYGCKLIKTKDKFIHLYHGRGDWDRRKQPTNKDIFMARRGIIKRNLNREWGKI